MIIRPATSSDAAAMLAIYLPIVTATASSFELEPPSLDEFAGRVAECSKRWCWLLAEEQGAVIGYAYGSAHRARPAYRWSAETSAYVLASAQGRGVGRRLYEALFEALSDKGYCNAYGGIALPNAASVALHESVGFAGIGVFPAVGRKFGKWHDVAWFHRRLREEPLGEE